MRSKSDRDNVEDMSNTGDGAGSKIREIPGFYYDSDKNRYFKIQQNAFNPSTSQYSASAIKKKTHRELMREEVAQQRSKHNNQSILHLDAMRSIGQLNYFTTVLPRQAATCVTNSKQLEKRSYNTRMGAPLIQSALLSSDDVLTVNTYVSPNDRRMDEIDKLVTNFREMNLSGRNGFIVDREDFCYNNLHWHEDDTGFSCVQSALFELEHGCIISNPGLCSMPSGSVIIFKRKDTYTLQYKAQIYHTRRDFTFMTGCPTVTDRIYTSSFEKIHEHNLNHRTTDMLLKLAKYDLYGYTSLAFEEPSVMYAGSKKLLALDLREKRSKRAKVLKCMKKDQNITSLLSLGNGYSLATGFWSGKISLFDVRNRKFYCSANGSEMGFTPMKLDETGRFLLQTAKNNSCAYIRDSKTLETLSYIDMLQLNPDTDHIQAVISSRYGLPQVLVASDKETYLFSGLN